MKIVSWLAEFQFLTDGVERCLRLLEIQIGHTPVVIDGRRLTDQFLIPIQVIQHRFELTQMERIHHRFPRNLLTLASFSQTKIQNVQGISWAIGHIVDFGKLQRNVASQPIQLESPRKTFFGFAKVLAIHKKDTGPRIRLRPIFFQLKRLPEQLLDSRRCNLAFFRVFTHQPDFIADRRQQRQDHAVLSKRCGQTIGPLPNLIMTIPDQGR